MDRIEMSGKLLLAITALVVEVSFWLLARSERRYPLVHYQTDFHLNSRAHREAGDFLYDAIPW